MREIKMRRHIHLMGENTVICIDNEEGSHIGSCVVATPYQKDGIVHTTCQIINQIAHKEEEIARMYASDISIMTNQVTCCVCGIHLDDITSEEMNYIYEWCKQDIVKLKEEVRNLVQE